MRPYWINSASTAMGLGNHPLSPRGLIWINGPQGRHWPDAATSYAGGPMSRLMILFAALLSLTSAAGAEDNMVVDMSKLTCAELNRLGFQDFAGITMWMSGYYDASVRNTTIDLDRFAQAAKTVKDHCATIPRATVMSAAERALGIKMPQGR
jgi:hypothetical protein